MAFEGFNKFKTGSDDKPTGETILQIAVPEGQLMAGIGMSVAFENGQLMRQINLRINGILVILTKM
jgi:hypothetical protein